MVAMVETRIAVADEDVGTPLREPGTIGEITIFHWEKSPCGMGKLGKTTMLNGKTMESSPFLMRKLPISTGPFSIAKC